MSDKMKTVTMSAVAVALFSSLAVFAAAPKQEESTQKMLVRVYNVADLPVWRVDLKNPPQFAPQVLLKCLQATVDPQSWNPGGAIKLNEREASLVITQTGANHEQVTRVLDSYRIQDGREVTERVGARQ